ncbi:MAG: glycoside hydrolase family 3 protein [Treponema sp.]|nr:glycoside hydrolase family 3 protein [Treponema sp.]
MKILCLALSALVLAGCEKTEIAATPAALQPVLSGGNATGTAALPLDVPAATEAVSEAEPKREEAEPARPVEMAAYHQQAKAIVSAMDDSTLAAQMIITGVDGNMYLAAGMKKLLQNSPPGAIMLFSYNLDADKDTIRSFLKDCTEAVAEKSAAPFLAVDHEGGRVHRFGPGAKRLPSAESYWYRTLAVDWKQALEEVEYHAFRSGVEIHDLGITMNFAPIAEILNNENMQFLDTRSYGPNPVFVEAACAAFIRGMERAGVTCVVKHFPGNAYADPHKALPVLTADRQTLDYMVKPFAGLIRTMRPAAIMVSHVVVQARDGKHNASLSPLIVNDWLRGELGFTGIAVADDFSMGAVASSGIQAEDAVIAALNAGVDMVMAWPSTLVSTHNAILAAIKSAGRGRFEEAAERIVVQKIRFGLVNKAQ